MHIIFGYLSYWQTPILKLLKYFNFDVYYLYINAKTNDEKIQIADKLKKKNIYPLPIELEKKILPAGFSIFFHDPDEFSYKKNVKLVPNPILKKFSSLFFNDEKKTKKLRLLIQDFVYSRQLTVSSNLGIWSALYPQKKIVYISFNFRCFYMSDIGHNIIKIIIPVDLLNYFIKIIEKIFLLLSSFINVEKKERENQSLNRYDLKEMEKKKVAFIPHKGLIYGNLTKKGHILFEKSLYYSDDKNSCLNKYNILHLDYANYLKPEENLNWICLNKIKVSNVKIFLKTLLASIKTLYLIRGWSTFLGWVLCIWEYSVFIKYCEVIKKFKNLKVAIIDYEVVCPKTLILALEKNNIKTFATQERFMHIFCTSYANVVIDTYYVVSEFAANFIKKSKYNDVKNIIPVGAYRSDYLSLYKKERVLPKEISEVKKNGKKILIVLGYSSVDNWFESYTSLIRNWSSQVSFLEDIIRLSQQLKDTFIVLRYKVLEWTANEYFKKILKKINNYENIIISTNFAEPNYAYKLCANADLIIAKPTSLGDECLSNEIPVLFHDYTHNLKRAMSEAFDYSPSSLMCHNFEELLEKSKSLLFNNSSKIKEEIINLNKSIFHVKEKGNIKKKIIRLLENSIKAIQ